MEAEIELDVDYRPKGGDLSRRLVLAFNEFGAWVEHLGLVDSGSIPA
jgi:hypothetical protein